MGCDIHIIVERKPKKTSVLQWSNWGKEFRLDRNYAMFGVLCEGVRSQPTFSFTRRGFPENLSHESLSTFFQYVTNGVDPEYVSEEQALKLEKEGCEAVYSDGKLTFIQHTDYHSCSWLTFKEFEVALNFYNENITPFWVQKEYEALLRALQYFDSSGDDVRIIFAFDN